MTALRHPKILTYLHIRSGFGAPSRLVLAPLVTFFSPLLSHRFGNGMPCPGPRIAGK
jgi:hypothetical protein